MEALRLAPRSIVRKMVYKLHQIKDYWAAGREGPCGRRAWKSVSTANSLMAHKQGSVRRSPGNSLQFKRYIPHPWIGTFAHYRDLQSGEYQRSVVIVSGWSFPISFAGIVRVVCVPVTVSPCMVCVPKSVLATCSVESAGRS